MIQVTIDGKGYEYPENCSYYEIAKDFEKTMDAPIVLVKVDGRLRELHKQLKKDCELEFVTTEDEIGHKTYQRSLSLLLVKAVYHVGGYDKIRHVMLHFSAGSGFFYTVDGDITLNQAFLDEVKAYMHEQVEKAVPIYKRSVDTHEARERFRLHGMTDKDRLFRYRRVSRVNLYSLGDFEDYYYGFMTYDTSYLKYFDLYLYDDGFVLQMPEKKAPETVPAANLSPKVFQVQRESERWGEQMGISTVAASAHAPRVGSKAGCRTSSCRKRTDPRSAQTSPSFSPRSAPQSSQSSAPAVPPQSASSAGYSPL